MYRKWKNNSRKDDFIDDCSDGEAPARKAVKRTSEDDSDGVVVCQLGNQKKVTVREWRGRVFVDIREFYTKEGRELPGKKGISLSLDQWEVLRDNIAAIDKAIKEMN